MPAGIEITNTDHTAEEVRALARKCKHRSEARHLRAIARVMEGEETRAGIARPARVDGQTLCDWVNRYNAMGLSGLKDKPGRGRPSKLSEAQRAKVGRWLDEGPEDGTPAWTVALIRDRIRSFFDIVMSGEAVRCLMRALGFRCLSPRPFQPKSDTQMQGSIPVRGRIVERRAMGSLRNRRIVLSLRDSPWNRNMIHSRHGYDREHPATVRGPVAAS